MNTHEIAILTSAIRLRVGEILAADPDTDAAALLAEVERDLPDTGRIVAALVRAIGEAQGDYGALDERIAALTERRRRGANKIDTLRALLHTAMEAAGQTKWKHPEFTVSLSPGRAGVVVTDPDALPDDFVRITRAPDKTAIGCALAEGKEVPGACIANAKPVLTVRTK